MEENGFVKNFLETIAELNSLKDIDAILDRLLFEVRRFCNADAGTIFLLNDGELEFSYVHNDTFSKQDDLHNNKGMYLNFKIPVNENSIVGYAAMSGEPVVIDDAYAMPDDLPYSFNPSFDKKTGYRTGSMLTFPIKAFNDRIMGVMQIINAQNEQGRVIPFSKDTQTILPLFANQASSVMERGMMTRRMVLRMMEMAELRDPTETGAHVQRVGAYSAEIYHRLAKKKGVEEDKLKRYKDLLRVAAMLHDVGKVGISDSILKKPDKLDDQEFLTMKQHTVFGGRLFMHSTADLDEICYDIALNHHERWNGKGYPGRVDERILEENILGEPKREQDIPLSARIVALADVYDALCSTRSYKAPMPEEKVLSIIEEEAGKHFDPEVVDAFFDVYEVILAIRRKYTETQPSEEEAKDRDNPGKTGNPGSRASKA